MIRPDLPIKALSIRQPWAWAILHAGKDIENRPRVMNYRGRVAIHASAWKRPPEENIIWSWMRDELNIDTPQQSEYRRRSTPRGGIVGSVEIVGCLTEMSRPESPWFFGPYGYVLRDPQPCEFIPVKGMLGLFDWRKNLEAII